MISSSTTYAEPQDRYGVLAAVLIMRHTSLLRSPIYPDIYPSVNASRPPPPVARHWEIALRLREEARSSRRNRPKPDDGDRAETRMSWMRLLKPGWNGCMCISISMDRPPKSICLIIIPHSSFLIPLCFIDNQRLHSIRSGFQKDRKVMPN